MYFVENLDSITKVKPHIKIFVEHLVFVSYLDVDISYEENNNRFTS